MPLDLHVQVEVGALGQRLAHGGADRLEDLAALADDDGLLRVALDDDLDADVRPLPLGHPAGDGVRQLVARLGQQLLAHQLGHPERLGRVGDHVGREVGRALGQPGDQVRPRARRRPRPVRAETGKYSTVGQLVRPSARRRPPWPGSGARAPGRCDARSTLFTTTTSDGRRVGRLVVVGAAPVGGARSAAVARALDLAHGALEHRAVARADGAVASTTAMTTSTSSSASVAVSFSRAPSAVRGRWMPGRVDEDHLGVGGRSCSTPRMRCRVVLGRDEVMVTLVPTMG